MSEYQYYEFQAIDRDLTDKEVSAIHLKQRHSSKSSFIGRLRNLDLSDFTANV